MNFIPYYRQTDMQIDRYQCNKAGFAKVIYRNDMHENIPLLFLTESITAHYIQIRNKAIFNAQDIIYRNLIISVWPFLSIMILLLRVFWYGNSIMFFKIDKYAQDSVSNITRDYRKQLQLLSFTLIKYCIGGIGAFTSQLSKYSFVTARLS